MKSELLDEARRLTIPERVELVEAIWDTVAHDASLDDLPLSEPHRLELDRRLEDWHARPEAAASWEDVLERLKRGQ